MPHQSAAMKVPYAATSRPATSPGLEETKSKDESAFDFSINGLLLNPLNGKNQRQIENLVDDFMDFTQIEDLFKDVVRKGAYLAQDEYAFQKPREDGLVLQREEEEAIKLERDHKWQLPFIMYALVGCCSMVSITSAL